MTAKQTAGRAFEKIRGNLESESTIPLSEYRSAGDYQALTGGSGYELLEHRAANSEFAKLLWFAGHQVEFIQIAPDEYFQWLENRENTSAARAQFVGWIAAGRPENWNGISGVDEL